MPAKPAIGIVSRRQSYFILIVLALAAGVVGASRFAAAAGFKLAHEDEVKVAFSGIVLGLLTLAVLLLLSGIFQKAVIFLAGASTRPGAAVNLTLIICGTVCIVAALGLSLWHATSSEEMQSSVEVKPDQGTANVTLRAGESLVFPALTIGVFLIGVCMVALGIWGSVRPNSASVPAVESGGH